MAWDSIAREIDYKLVVGKIEYGKDKIIRVNLSEGFSGERSLGSVVSSQLNAELYLKTGEINKGDRVVLFVREKQDTYRNTCEFTVNAVSKKGKTVSITCYDKLFNADKQIGEINVGGNLVPVDDKSRVIGYPLDTYLSNIASKLKIPERPSTYTILVRPPYPTTTNMRSILQDAAAISMSHYMIDRLDRLHRIPIFSRLDSVIEHTFSVNDYIECELLEDTPRCTNVILNINNENTEMSSYRRNPKTALVYNLEYATDQIQTFMELNLSSLFVDKNFTMTCRGSFDYEIGDSIEVTMKDGNSFYSRIMHIVTNLTGGMTQTISCGKLQGIGEVESERDSIQSRFVAVKKTASEMEKVKQGLDVDNKYTKIRHSTDPYLVYGKVSGKPISESVTFHEEGMIQSYIRTGGTPNSSGGATTFSTENEDAEVKYEKSIGTELNKDGLFHLVDDIETGEVEKVRIPKTYIDEKNPNNEVGEIGDIWIQLPASIEGEG